jgi:ethanolamine utilization protein EutN
MRIAKVIGNVTLNRAHPSFDGATLKLAIPLTLENILDDSSELRGEFEVVWDDLGAGNGNLIAMAEGPEACRPFRPEKKPVSAYNAAILDDIKATNIN